MFSLKLPGSGSCPRRPEEVAGFAGMLYSVGVGLDSHVVGGRTMMVQIYPESYREWGSLVLSSF